MEASINELMTESGVLNEGDMRNVRTGSVKQLQSHKVALPLHFQCRICFMSFSSTFTHRSVWTDEGVWTSKTGKRSMHHLRCDSGASGVGACLCVYISAVADLIRSSGRSDRECEVMGFESAPALCISDH